MRLKGYQGMVDGGECIELAEWKTVSGIIQKVSLLLLCILSTGTEIFIVNAYLILKSQVLIVIYSHCAGVQLPARSSASVLRGIVPSSRRCHIKATSPIRHPTAPGRTASPAQLLADGLSVWLVRRSGIPCQTACRIRLLAGTVSDNL